MNGDDAGFSDGELAALAQAGRQSAFGQLMTRHREAVFRFARNYSGNADDALDLTQETFVAAFGGLDRYENTRPFRPWLLRIALNKCRDWSRARAVRRLFTFAVPVEAADAVPDPYPGPDTQAADARELARVSVGIARLPDALKAPLILHAIDGLSQAEVAQTLGISEKAVEVRVHRARKKLVEMLRG